MILKREFFLFLHKNLCCWYSLESPRRVDSNEYPQHRFKSKEYTQHMFKPMLWVLIRIAIHRFLCRTDENYPLIISKYTPYLSQGCQ